MLVLLALIIWPIAELYVAIQVAEAIGVLLTVLALIVSWPLGNFHSRVMVQATRFGRGGVRYDVDSTASDVDPTRLPR